MPRAFVVQKGEKTFLLQIGGDPLAVVLHRDDHAAGRSPSRIGLAARVIRGLLLA